LEKTYKKLDKEESKLANSQKAKTISSLSRNSPASEPRKEYADDTERQIDENLDEISGALDHLKESSIAMQSELARQNTTITRIQATTEHTDYTLTSANRKINEFL